MNPAFIDQMSWEMAEVYGAITDQILINLSRYFPYYKAGMKVPKSAFTYQAAMLAQMGKVNRETVKIIRDGLKGADKALQGVLEQAIINSVKKAEPDLLKAVKQGILNPPSVPVVAPNQMRAFQLYYNQAAGKLNLVNTVMLESTQQAYKATVADIATRIQTTQTALDIATGETVTGVSAWNEAVKHGIDRLKAGGITGFIDHGNHKWSAEAYVAMDVRTTAMNTGRAAVWEVNQDFGNDLYLVSYHSGARPLCYDWQNKVISAVNNARDITDIDGNTIHVYAQSETTYGQAAGLFGINCKHYPSPFIPGVSQIHGQPQSEEANAKTYAESQEQRRLERKLREEKRDFAMMKARGVPEEQLKAQQARIKQSSSDIDEFCKQTGRARHRDREAVYTQREFPSKDTYDVKEFTRDQKDIIESFYKNGGEQINYTFGEMKSNEQPQSSGVPANGQRTSLELPKAPERPRKYDFSDENDYWAAYDKYKVERDAWKAKRDEIIDSWVSDDRTIKTHEEFAEFAKIHNIRVDKAFVENVDPLILDDLAKVDSEMISRFPEVKARQDALFPFGHSYEETFNYLMEGSRGINFGESFRDARDVYRQVIDAQTDGFMVKGDGTLRTVMRHEYGHNVDSYIREKFSTLDADYSWKVSGKTERRYAALRQYETELKEITLRFGSEYSQTNTLEAFAEGFAEYTSNPASEYGRTFGDFFERWYNASPIE